jgi:hypothetical protein
MQQSLLNSGRAIASKITSTIKTTEVVFESVIMIVFEIVFHLKNI